MEFMPALRFGILNGGLLLVAYFVGLITSALTFPRDKRTKLFLEPPHPKDVRGAVRLLGQVAAVCFVVLSFFTPLRMHGTLFYLGLTVYAIGYVLVMAALQAFKRAPADEVVSAGVYRYSRSPQWLGLAAVFVGTALAMAVWLLLALVALVVVIYHLQILFEEQACLSAYGEKYRDYMHRVPRYWFV